MEFRLGDDAAAAGYRFAGYASIGSTNAEALARARTGDPGKLWIVALQQTAGRGRRGRPWQTPPGNLAATLLLRTSVGAASAATLGFVAGVALQDAIRAVASSSPSRLGERPGPRAARSRVRGPAAPEAPPHPLTARVGLPPVGRGEELGARLELKWPNDVLLDDAKLAGILLEAEPAGDGTQAVAIGMGVNTLHAPSGLPYPTASLASAGLSVSAAALFEALSDAWVRSEAEWDGARGFAATRRRWLDRAAGLGRPISVAQGDRSLAGVFDTIDDTGRLVLRSKDGSLHHITAGDVHFGAAATSGTH